MPHPAADRNLLLGVLALQMDFIDRDQLIAAMNAWAIDKSRPLGEVLVAQGALPPRRLALLDTLVEEHIDQHGRDAAQSLAAAGAAPAVRAALSAVADPAVRATLSAALGDGRSAERTSAYRPEATPDERYVLLRLHARGGLGEVFVARDAELRREVALKQIQDRCAQDPVSRARFVLEAEVTGNLEHPGIVPVYGFGQQSDGRPYYAMRLVRGESLREAIGHFHQARHASAGARSLELRRLLGSFVAVCQAVHYAHSRGVLHRDLKPDNVMLGQFGETLVVDWGLAKPVDRPNADAERSLADGPLRPASGSEAQTVAGSTIGTPAYMSPEQAEGRLEHLTAASDVYSLGATLYCLLTGRAPFQGETGEVLPRVRKGDFPAPRAVNPLVPPALEAVCLRAMALSPADRYPSARALAEDLDHWMADEPVAAYREPVATRLARWARCHRPLVAGAAGLLVTAVVALGVGLVLLGRAGSRTEEQRQRAEANFAEAQRQRDLARRAVDDYFVQVSESTLLKSPQPGLQPLRKQLLESALKYYQEFVRQAGDDPRLQADLAQAYFRVGAITADIGNKAEAKASYGRALQLYQALGAADPQSVLYRSELARVWRALGRAEAESGRWVESEAAFFQAVTLGEALVREKPDVPELQRDLAWSYNNLSITQFEAGRTAPALQSLGQSIATWKRLVGTHPRAEFRVGLAQAYSNLGWDYTLGGRLPQALAALQQAVAINEEVVKGDEVSPGFRQRLAFSLDNLGHVYYYSGQSTNARQSYQRALAIAEQLSRDNPAVSEFKEELINYRINLAHALLDLGQDREARRAFELALEVSKTLKSPYSRSFTYASIHRGLGKLLRKEGKSESALKAFQQAVEVGEKGAGGERPYTTYELACARALCAALVGAGKAEPTAAEQAAKRRYAEQAVAALREAVAGGWENVTWMRKDPDLDALRARADFEKLVAGLEKKHAGKE